MWGPALEEPAGCGSARSDGRQDLTGRLAAAFSDEGVTREGGDPREGSQRGEAPEQRQDPFIAEPDHVPGRSCLPSNRAA